MSWFTAGWKNNRKYKLDGVASLVADHPREGVDFAKLAQGGYVTNGGYPVLLADPGEVRDCSINSFVINWLIKSVILFLTQLYGAATPKWFEIALPVIKLTMSWGSKTFLSPEGHHNRLIGSKVPVILLKGWNLPICGAVLGKVSCNQRGYPV